MALLIPSPIVFRPVIRVAAAASGTAIVSAGVAGIRSSGGAGSVGAAGPGAADFYERALTIRRRIGHPTGIATELGNLGEVMLRRGKHWQAIGYLRRALVTWQKATAGPARTSERHHLQPALALYTQLGAPEADQVRSQLGAASL